MKRTFTTIVFALLCTLPGSQHVSAAWPVRFWDDDMPRHTFYLGMGPSFFPKANPLLDGYDIPSRDGAAAGFEFSVRYDWSYLRGYEVSLATGATYIFSRGSNAVDGGFLFRDVRVRETFNYVGSNLVSTKMWFGKRTIWDVSIHMGYAGSRSFLTFESLRFRLRENGFMAGLSTGVDVLVTAWLGVGLHADVLTGVMYPSGGAGSRDYTRGSVRVGAVYCF